jgi:hypothetical protein
MRTGIAVFMRVGFALTSTQFASQQCSNEQHTNSSSAAAKQTRVVSQIPGMLFVHQMHLFSLLIALQNI